jgi:outer membrane protein assembly factor BamB
MEKAEQLQLYSILMKGSAVFCVIISLLLLLNYIQISKNDPLESTTMTTLLERLEEEPNNKVLIEEIRNLDLLARKAFFNNQWQINTGALLLLISGIIFGISLRGWHKLQFGMEMPPGEVQDAFKSRNLTQRGLITGGAVLLLLALGATYFSKDHLHDFKFNALVKFEPETFAEPIEVVDVNTGPANEITNEQNPVLDTISAETGEKSPPSPGEEKTPTETSELVYPDLATIFQQHGSFRGPLGNGVSRHTNIPINWNPEDGNQILWKTSLSKEGNNSPVIWGNRLFLAAGDASGKIIYCINRHSGAVLWDKLVQNIPGSPSKPPKVTEDTGLSAPTLVTDGNYVFGIFADGDIVCLDMDGQEIWSKNLGVPDNHYGHASSLILWKNKLFVQYDSNRGGKVMALDAKRGASLWETDRKVKISWSSPILASVEGQYQLILASDPLVAAYDIESGKELWSVDCLMGEVGSGPAYGDGLIFAANEYAKLVAIRPSANSGTIVWENDEYLPEVASPVVADGILFIATSYGVLAAYNAQNGEKYWEHECAAGFYASPVIADGKVYAIDMDGTMHIFKVDKEKILIAEPPLGESVVATPAFAPGRIYIRGTEHLYCIGS